MKIINHGVVHQQTNIETQTNSITGHTGEHAEPPSGVTPFLAELNCRSPVSKMRVGTVFISHANEDRVIAVRVDTALRRHEIQTWMAERDILPGQEWDAAIVEGINRAWLLVLLYSESAGRSLHVRSEVRLARDNRLALLPVRLDRSPLEKAMEYWLPGSHWLDVTDDPAGLEQRVADAVRQLIVSD